MTEPTMRALLRPAAIFIAIGLALYALLFVAAEQLVMRTGRANALFKIERADANTFDWLILGASHAMPLDFADFNAHLEAATGKRILNLAAPGAGPLYNRFVYAQFQRRHGARNVLYVVDSFAFYSRTWNEDRLADPKLLGRTPFDGAVAADLWRYVRHEGVPVHAVLDFVTGFSKINNRDRFDVDAWEGEAQFERTARASKTAIARRIAYLYPDGTPHEARTRYLDVLVALIEAARASGSNVIVLKLPLPPAFRRELPDEDAFDAALAQALAPSGTQFIDLSAALTDLRFYFDTDHLNRAGLDALLRRELKDILASRASQD